jgi:hypothetical protein
MVFAQLWMRVETDTFPIPVYACQEPGCTAHYNIIHGYFDIEQGKGIERDMKAWVKCTVEGLPMYVAQFEPQKSKRVWQCSQVGCTGSRVTEGPLREWSASA